MEQLPAGKEQQGREWLIDQEGQEEISGIRMDWLQETMAKSAV